MKRLIQHIILVIIFLATPSVVSAQVAALEKYQGAAGMSYVYVSQAMLRMAAKYGGEANAGNIKIDKMIDKLTSLQVVTSLNSKSGERLAAEVKAAAVRGDYLLLMSADDCGTSTQIYLKEGKSKKSKSSVIIIEKQAKQTKAVGIDGYFSSGDISTLIR